VSITCFPAPPVEDEVSADAALLATAVAGDVDVRVCAALVAAVLDAGAVLEAAALDATLAAVVPVVAVADPPQAASRPPTELDASSLKQPRRESRTAYMDTALSWIPAVGKRPDHQRRPKR